VTVFTIGHSTRSLDEFLSLLEDHGVTGIVDVRTVPRSRRHPQFGRESLAESLPAHGCAYEHLAALGGLRKPRRDSQNGGWRHESFRGYADYMQEAAFGAGIDALLRIAVQRTTAVMCAEAKWWQCHRQLIADALVARGVEVRHIMSPRQAPAHALPAFARTDGTRVWYPSTEQELFTEQEPFTDTRSLKRHT
jgi:uncharacterized protein (DUF488 family)